MLWYRTNGDGTAAVYEDSPAIRAQVDADPRRFYGTAEGPILHGGVQACAFERTTERTYDAVHWLHTQELVPAGEITVTKITAEPKGN